MAEERLNEGPAAETDSGNSQNLKETDIYLKENESYVHGAEEAIVPEPETEAAPDPEPEIELLRKDTKEALIIGAVLGLVIGILMFFVPSSRLEEGARLTISVILILLGPRLVQDKYHIDFTKGRFTMAGALVLTLIIYILIGHPVK